MDPNDSRHGTERGYYTHRHEREKACPACTTAHSAAEKRRTMRRMNGDDNWIPALGTRRRIQALSAIGWAYADIAEAGGAKRTASDPVRKIANGTRRVVWRGTADRINTAFERLSGTAGPWEICRTKARAKGWAPPLAWDNIDNPDEKPQGAAWRTRTPGVKPRKPKPLCGTERGYQWHRHQWRRLGNGQWPLPEDDPCGCRAAHRAWWHWRQRQDAAA